MQRPRIKAVHVPERLSGGRIRIGTSQYGVAAELVDDPQGTAWLLMGLMDGSRDREAISAELRRAMPALAEGQIDEAIGKLVAGGFVEDAAAAPAELTQDEAERYEGNAHYFAWVDVQPRASRHVHQERLKSASVTVLGLGGTGSAVVASLTAAGVGGLRCVDGDSVEPENLTRQLLYTEGDVGRPKAEAAAERLRQLNPLVDVAGELLWIDSAEKLEPLMDCDLFVLCADQPQGEIQRWVNRAALRTRTPWILSAYTGPTLVVGTFIPEETPCYRCFEHDVAARDDAGELLFERGDINAVIAPTANLAGHFAALEAIYFLTGLKAQTVGRVFHQNLMIYGHNYFLEAPFWPECPECGGTGSGNLA